MRHLPTWLVLVFSFVACAGGGQDSGLADQATIPPPARVTVPTGALTAEGAAPIAAKAADAKAPVDPVLLDPLRHRDDLPEDQRLLVIIGGKDRIVDINAARAAGYTAVNLRDDWVPFIFQTAHDAEGHELKNRYRAVFVGLANDLADGDGRPLPKDEKNYLEVFGIPPAVSALRDRFIGDSEKACHAEIDYDLMASMDAVTYRNDRRMRRHKRKLKALKKKLAKAMKKAKVEDYAALRIAKPKLVKKIKYVEAGEQQLALLAAIDARLNCDGHNHKKYRHKPGRLDTGLRHAVRRFQRKHMIYEHTNLKKHTMEVMGMKPLVTNHMALRRVLTERIVAATGILEDGSTEKNGTPATYTDAAGYERPLRNLVEEFTGAALTQLGLDTPEGALAFFQRRPREDFTWLKVGVKFPKLPEYYSEHMDLSVYIDRGDIFYDQPFLSEGKKLKQHRKRLPKYYLVLKWQGQRIRLVRWKTTIGGWRTEQAKDGYIYNRYKNSDVGNRVIRKILSGPVWVPPATTPLKSLSKRRYVNGKAQNIVNYGELGPGYLSAYGLVAGYFVIPGRNGRPDHDRGIRAHGSSDYMSILSSRRFSHGCHRLMNHLAVRLYGFILNHRHSVAKGDQVINHRRQFLRNGHVYEIRLPSRGFQYTLDPPLPVTVGKGNIRSEARKPIEGLVKIPGKAYPDPEEEEAPGADVAPEGE